MFRPLSALLSQTLVAYTVEFDNEFEHRMRAAGYAGAMLSLTVWADLMRFLTEGEVSVRDLVARSQRAEPGALELGCLERWGFVVLRGDGAGGRREGWGTGRGIRAGSLIGLTAKGRTACSIWPGLFELIEGRWRARFGGDVVDELQSALADISVKIDPELPTELPGFLSSDAFAGWRSERPPQATGLPYLLADVLAAFTVEFERESRVPLRLCANTLRVLGETPVSVSELPGLTGASTEASDIGWELKRFVKVGPAPTGKRGKVVQLTPLGLGVQQKYHRLIQEIEERWAARFGKEKIRRLRDCLNDLFVGRSLAEGMIPHEGTFRAGAELPALGRRDVGPAARQRMRDLVAQTERFVRDPASALPHYPLWDMNRGFGP